MKVDKSKWQRKSFYQLGNSQLGKTLDSKKNKGKPYPYLCAFNVGYGSFYLSSIKEILLEDDELERYLVKKGDLLICEGGDTGRCAIWNSDEPIYYQNALHRVRFNSDVFNRFVMYAMHYYKQTGIIDVLSHGQTIKHLTQKGLSRLYLSTPTFDEQQAIASELDAVQEMIDGYKAQIADLDVLAQSIFLDMFGDPISNPKGWEKNFMGNLFSIKRGGSPRPIKKYLTTSPDGINWIKIGDTDKSMFISSCKEKIIPEGKSKSRFVHQGDFLLSNSMSFGKPYILKVDGCIHDGWLVIEQSPKFESYVLYFILNSPSLYEVFTNKAKGAVVNNLNIDLVSSVEIPTPPIKLQQHFATQVEAIEQQKELLRQQLADAETLMAERMQYYFS